MFITGYTPFADRGILIRVETDIRTGIPGIDISGLADGAVKESRERIRAAFRTSGFEFPNGRVLINMAPAGVKKEGAELDLTIALSVMAASGLVAGLDALPEQLMALGELELSGRVRPVRGVLAAVASGLAEGIRYFIIPKENEEEAAILLNVKNDSFDTAGAKKIHYAAVASLDEAAHALVFLTTEGNFPPSYCNAFDIADDAAAIPDCGDFSEARGQRRYKRALEIAAAGGHNLLVFGVPGAGKTMLARRLPSIMAPLTAQEAVEATRIHSIAGVSLQSGFSLVSQPPFRSPHHSASAEGMLGGGRTVRPGEISLAHLGILFLDEAPEFRVNVLQALREPLEDRVVTIVRADGQVKLPADFQLIMAANACPCGRLGMYSGPAYYPDLYEEGIPEGDFSAGGECLCGSEEIRRYWKKFGGALLDRIEIRVPVQSRITENEKSESSAEIRERVIKAVEIQQRRFSKSAGSVSGGADGGRRVCRRNSGMGPSLIKEHCRLGANAETAFNRAAERLSFSGRAYYNILKVARTIADLEGKEKIETDHILEAVQHRRFGDDPYDIFLGIDKNAAIC
jgi:magnesium chelatase family protein